jgi:hypothetical protein
VALTVVVDNASDPPVTSENVDPLGPGHTLLIRDPEQPVNISRLWNVALEHISDAHRFVAFLCDDAIVPVGWFHTVSQAMLETGAAAGASNPDGGQHPHILKKMHDRDLGGRMCGWAFILDVTSGVKPDENFHWWWCDTDVDWQARLLGGTVIVSGYPVPNVRPNDFLTTVDGLGQRAGADGEAFVAKWGSRPW